MFCLITSNKLYHPLFEFSLKVKVIGLNPGYFFASSKLSHPLFEFAPKVKVMGSNPGYLLKYFLL